MRRLIIGISGASGAIYGIRALQALKAVPDIGVRSHEADPSRGLSSSVAKDSG